MARIYEFPNTDQQVADLEGSRLTAFDPITQRALLKFWIAAPGIVVAAGVLYFLSRSGRIEPTVAIWIAVVVAAFALVLLFIMNRSLLSMRVISKDDASVDKRLGQSLSQLDDRFAIFSGVSAGDQALDHLIVGPSGIFTVKASATLEKNGWARAADIEQLMAEGAAIDDLLKELVPSLSLTNQTVLCVPAGTTIRLDQESRGVWIVPVDKLAVSLIKRSSAEGAISENVNETGAFSSDAMQSAAVERALAHHWDIPTRRTQTDYVPPSDLTGEIPPQASTE